MNDLLGRGGMGEVWRATLSGPHGFRKTVAVKLLSPRAEDELARAALIREARYGATLSHPNLVSVHELGDVDGVVFVAMELVRGPSTGELVRRHGPLSVGQALDVALQMCAAIEHFHQADPENERPPLVHGDLKPRNVMVDRSGLVKVVDLGIARLAGSHGASAGTLGYVAPEQADGMADTRSDLYGLAATLYALLAGRAPFGPGPAALADALRFDARATDERWRAPLRGAPGLEELVVWCLAPDPCRRPRDASEVRAALTHVREHLLDAPTLLDLVDGGSRGATPDTAPPRASPESGNIPELRDAFVGRDRELQEIARGLDEGRVVSLVGPGGVGKTRLANEAATRARASYRSAWVCDLSAARTEEALVAGVAATLGLQPDRGDPTTALGHAIARRGAILVVLDNLEQVARLAGPVVARWSETAPLARFVVTSQVALRIRAERVVKVGPLKTDDAVALFLARGRSLDDDAAQVRKLVRRVDRLPLAIELAAARTRTLSVTHTLERLDDRFRLLAGGASDLPARHRSLRASLEASFELLDTHELAALQQLSVFAGAFELGAAEAVVDCGSEAAWTVDLVTQLADRSLVQVSPRGDRFRLLSSVREFAQAMADPQTTRAATSRHLAYHRALCEQLPSAPSLMPYLDDLLVALRRAVEAGDSAAVDAIAMATAPALEIKGRAFEGAQILELALPLVRGAGSPTAVELALIKQWRAIGRSADASELATEILARARAEGDPITEGRALHALGAAHFELGRLAEAKALVEEARTLVTRTGPRRSYASVTGDLGVLTRLLGD
ncbi:MAG: protein kinase, partial [Myxococcales bacterium]|nr:protein kinase [Myxococcales bacterium]